jgi:hypothetical protein
VDNNSYLLEIHKEFAWSMKNMFRKHKRFALELIKNLHWKYEGFALEFIE